MSFNSEAFKDNCSKAFFENFFSSVLLLVGVSIIIGWMLGRQEPWIAIATLTIATAINIYGLFRMKKALKRDKKTLRTLREILEANKKITVKYDALQENYSKLKKTFNRIDELENHKG